MKLSLTQIVLLVALVAIWFVKSDQVTPPPTPVVEVKADLVAFVYESEDGALPSYVFGASAELVERGINVRPIDDDVETGLGGLPIEIAKAIVAGRANGLPAMVVMGGGDVLSVMNLPSSKEAISEAVK